MKLLNLLFLPLFLALAPAAQAQRGSDVVTRYIAAVVSEVDEGIDDLDAAYLGAERRLLSMIQEGARDTALRLEVQRSRETFHTMVTSHERVVRAAEAEMLDLLTRLGAGRDLRARVEAIATRELGRLERHEIQVMKHLHSLLDRVG